MALVSILLSGIAQQMNGEWEWWWWSGAGVIKLLIEGCDRERPESHGRSKQEQDLAAKMDSWEKRGGVVVVQLVLQRHLSITAPQRRISKLS
ncbi:hypothetical protein ACEPAF_8691 [Sanghuangporus sanghuang]